MKRLSDEKTGLKIEPNRFSFFFFFICLTAEIIPQIPINGFCKLNTYQFSAGYSKLVSLNFNNDSYSDLLLYNPSSKTISVTTGQKNETFSKASFFEFPFSLSNLNPIWDRNNRIRNYAFTSRKDLTAGICNFSSDGKPEVTHSISFESYPQNLSIADADDDNQQEILISGPAFEGLSILKLVGKNLNETKILSKGSYSQAIFIDLTNDKYPDIAAFNLLSNSLEFLFNNGRGRFKLERTIQLNQKVNDLHSFDMNLDSYQDLIFTEGNSIQIYYGDFTSSYSKQKKIETTYYPDKLIIGDFNKDGEMDISYLNLEVSIISLCLAKSEFEFFKEISIIQRDGIKSLIPFYSKFIDGLAVINEDGILLTNTRLKSLSSDQDLSLSLSPKTINYFDANNDGVNDFGFIDDFDNSLKLIIRNNAGVPANYYSIQLRGNYDQIVTKSFSKYSTSFFCYSANKKLIEEINVEFSSGKIFRSEFYSSRPIIGLAVVQDEKAKVFISSLVNNRLTVEVFEKDEIWELLTDFNVSEKAISVYLSTFKGLKLFFWNQDGDSVKLFMKTLLPAELKTSLVVKRKLSKIENIVTVAGDFMNKGNESVISFVESGEKQYILVSNDGFLTSFDLKELNRNLRIKSAEELFIGEMRPQSAKRLIVSNHSDQAIYLLNILKNGKRLVFSKMLSEINSKSYFVCNMTVENYHLVYVNQTKSCISVRQI